MNEPLQVDESVNFPCKEEPGDSIELQQDKVDAVERDSVDEIERDNVDELERDNVDELEQDNVDETERDKVDEHTYSKSKLKCYRKRKKRVRASRIKSVKNSTVSGGNESSSVEKPDLRQTLLSFQKDGYLCDTVLVGEDGRVKAHSVVLAAASDVFKASFKTTTNESQQHVIVLPGMKLYLLQIAVLYAYMNEIIVPKKYMTTDHLLLIVNALTEVGFKLSPIHMSSLDGGTVVESDVTKSNEPEKKSKPCDNKTPSTDVDEHHDNDSSSSDIVVKKYRHRKKKKVPTATLR